MDFLSDPEDRGYPVEYLLSRIRGRRSRLIADWRQLAYRPGPIEPIASHRRGRPVSAETAWKDLAQEYQWVYTQMSRSLREIFRPFFEYAELRTLFICLRQVKDKKAGRAAELLNVSLLSDEIRHALMTGNDVLSAVSRVERIFASQAPALLGLEERYRSEGLRGVEQLLTNAFLTFIVSTRLHPLIRSFFGRVIDSRNIMGLVKYTGMEFSALPTFLNNGSVPAARFTEIIGREDPSATISLMREVSGIRLERNEPAQVEIALYTWISRYLKTAGRDPLNIGLIIDYLWRRSIEAMNLGVLHHGKDLERDAVIAALVA